MHTDRSGVTMIRHVIAQLEAATITPPDDCIGEARAMFEEIASANKARPWSAAHALLLADYCRVSLMWKRELATADAEGLVVAGKPNPRLRAIGSLARDRSRLARLLGLIVNPKSVDALANVGSAKLRAVGHTMRDTLAGDDAGLLA